MMYIVLLSEAVVENVQSMDTYQATRNIEWLNYIIPVVVVLVTYFVGTLQNRTSYKKKQMQLRYDKFYIPYIRELYVGAKFNIEFQYYSIQSREKLVSTALENVQYLGEKSQSYFPELYLSHATRVLTKKKGDDLKPLNARLNQAFSEFTQAVIEEAKPLCKKLNLPDITHTYKLRCKLSKEELVASFRD